MKIITSMLCKVIQDTGKHLIEKEASFICGLFVFSAKTLKCFLRDGVYINNYFIHFIPISF